MTHNEKNQSTETNPVLTEMLKLGDKNIKTDVITVLPIYEKLSTDIKDIFKKDPNQTPTDESHNISD